MREIYLTLLAVTFSTAVSSQKKVTCYLPEWGFLPGEIDTFGEKCTDIIYAFIKPGSDGSLPNYNKEHFQTLQQFHEKHPDKNIILSVGGAGSATNFESIAQNPKNFINSVNNILKQYSFQGLDLDWEFPQQKSTFTKLAEAIKQNFGEKYLLTAAVNVFGPNVENYYEKAALCKHLDYVNLMAYDLQKTDAKSSHAPFVSTDKSYTSFIGGAKEWSNGCPRQKLVVGVPFYGKNSATGETKIYSEICKNIKDGTMTKDYDKTAQASFAVLANNIFYSYDDMKNLKKKSQYVLDNDYAGIMIWSVDQDDSNGQCHNVKYPLLTAIHETLTSDSKSSKGSGVSYSDPYSKVSVQKPKPNLKNTKTYNMYPSYPSSINGPSSLKKPRSAFNFGHDATKPKQYPNLPYNNPQAEVFNAEETVNVRKHNSPNEWYQVKSENKQDCINKDNHFFGDKNNCAEYYICDKGKAVLQKCPINTYWNDDEMGTFFCGHNKDRKCLGN